MLARKAIMNRRSSHARPRGGRPGRRAGAGGLWLPAPAAWFCGAFQARAQTNAGSFNLNIGLNGLGQPADVDSAIKVLAVMTLLTLAPSIILLMTCFTRIVIVLSFVRSALSLQGAPSNQIIIGLSLFLTFFIMAPVWERIDQEALEPYRAKQITSQVALDRAAGPIRTFMLKQTRPKDVELFAALAKTGPDARPTSCRSRSSSPASSSANCAPPSRWASCSSCRLFLLTSSSPPS